MMAIPMRKLTVVLSAVLAGCVGEVGEMPPPDAGSTDGGGQAMMSDPVPDAGRTEPDAGTIESDAGTEDAGTPPLDAGMDRVPVFVAVGKQGRRALSCDDGRTWKSDVSVDDAWPANERYRCFSGDFTLPDGGTQSTDCDHNAYSSTSLAYVDGAFVQTEGWGAPGTFWRTTDGVTWQQVFTGANVQDVMVGDGRLIAATRATRRSDDQGLTWTNGPEIPLSNGSNTIWNVRGGVFGGGTFLVTSQDGANVDFAYSVDRGETWRRPTLQGGGRVDDCGAGHPVYGGGVFLLMSWSSAMNATIVCRSTDGAATWTRSTLSAYVESRPVWTGSGFVAWSNGQVHRSPDGATWTSAPTQTRKNGVLSAGPNPGPVAVNADGTFVAVKGGWQVWYEQQRFYRSTDGVLWDELAPGDFLAGHPITAMAAGFVSRGACP